MLIFQVEQRVVIVAKQLTYLARVKESQGYFNKVCLYRFLLALTFLGFFFNPLLLGRKGEVSTLFFHLLFFRYLQLKIAIMPNQHILGQHVLNLLISDSLMSSVLRTVVLYILSRFSVASYRKKNIVFVTLSCLEVQLHIEVKYFFMWFY